MMARNPRHILQPITQRLINRGNILADWKQDVIIGHQCCRYYKKWFPNQEPRRNRYADNTMSVELYPSRYALPENRGYVPTLSPTQVQSFLLSFLYLGHTYLIFRFTDWPTLILTPIVKKQILFF